MVLRPLFGSDGAPCRLAYNKRGGNVPDGRCPPLYVPEYVACPYSYLMASMGSRRAAFLAGYHPKKTPVNVQTAKLMMMVHISM